MNETAGKFLHKIQQHKMRELWDNAEDEDWEKCLDQAIK